MVRELGLHHELTLLALNDSKGTFEGTNIAYAIAGAMLSELLLRQKIDAGEQSQQSVRLISEDATGDKLLDEFLGQVNSAQKPKTLQEWVTTLATSSDLAHRIASQLADWGIVERDEKKVLWIFTKRIYPELDSSYEDAIRSRMADAMFRSDSEVDDKTVVLIQLASKTNLLFSNFASVELQQHRQRINDLGSGKLLATGATQESIEAFQAAMMAVTITTTTLAAVTAATSS